MAYSPQLDGMRAICIIFTILNHVGGKPAFINGTIGVDVFFPLSGFLITGIMMGPGWAGLRPYYIRRFFRIAPVYYLGLAVTVLFTYLSHHLHLGESRLDQLPRMLVPALLFCREWSSAPTLFGHAWTIGMEEKFYLVWPLILLVVRPAWARCGVIAITLLLLSLTGHGESLRGYGGIGLGCLSAMAFFRWGWRPAMPMALAMLGAAYLFCLESDFWWRNIAMAAAAAVFIAAVYQSGGVVARTLATGWLVHLGKLTFAIYLFHVLVLALVKVALGKVGLAHWGWVFAIGYAMSVVVAQWVHVHVEMPLIAYGRRVAQASVEAPRGATPPSGGAIRP
jgi:peptidoglycan/LPS O-acetylase OafA/YrhL